MSSSKSRVFNCYISGVNCGESLEQLREYCDWYIGQEEIGSHGMVHYQLMFGFKNGRHLTAVQRALDFGGNVEITADTQAMYKYCTDQLKRAEGTELMVYGEVPNFRRKRDDNELVIQEALKQPTYEAAMKYVEETNLMMFINSYQRLAFYFNQKFDISDKALYTLDQFLVKPVDVTKKVCVFVGKTGLGKTQFALAHFKSPLHIRDKEDYRRYSDKIDGIVMDDLAFRRWEPMTFLKMLDMKNPVTQSVKYGSVRIRAGCPRIICVSKNEEKSVTDTEAYAYFVISKLNEITTDDIRQDVEQETVKILYQEIKKCKQ